MKIVLKTPHFCFENNQEKRAAAPCCVFYKLSKSYPEKCQVWKRLSGGYYSRFFWVKLFSNTPITVFKHPYQNISFLFSALTVLLLSYSGL
ncbi:MAG: hypothetical protein LC660_07325 [Desulfobacteraceae bacterium]|nr:hypothetical protein [Desulfobacteraceae bacterium]